MAGLGVGDGMSLGDAAALQGSFFQGWRFILGSVVLIVVGFVVLWLVGRWVIVAMVAVDSPRDAQVGLNSDNLFTREGLSGRGLVGAG